MIGTTLRIRYEITGLLSEGPIFTAYAARDRLLARDVTVRLFRSPYDKEKPFVEAVERAVERTRKVQHPGIEGMLNLDEHEDLPFLVSELSRGALLADRIRKLAPFSVPVAIGMTISILEGLEALHNEGVVHGDIGTHNIVIQTDGSARVQLSGLWECYSSSASAGAAVVPYMAPYLAPEVGTGSSPSFASDVYAVGVVLYQLLSARFPFTGETPAAITQKHSSEPAPLIRSVVSSAPAVLEEVLKKTMAKNSGDRYSDAGDLLSDLRVLQDSIRFGKTLSWPISGRQTAAGKPVEVAPKMGAVRRTETKRPTPKPDQAQEWERPSADVPLWLRLVLFLSFFCFAGAVGGFVYFNLNRPKEVTVPNLKNLTQNEADSSLLASGLRQGAVTRVPNEQVPRDKVIDQSPHSGDKVKEGGVVSFRLSSGSHFAQVPDLIGHTVDEAHSMLEELGLNLDDKLEDGPSSVVERGKIIGQFPEKKEKVERGTRVRVKVSSGAPTAPDKPEVAADDDDTFVYKLKLPLKGLKDTAIVRIDMTDDYGTRTIFQEKQDPGDVVSLNTEGHGKEATFDVYYDEEKVLTQTEKPKKK